ncbi:Receptor-like protein 12 [Dichanthelium oligosanthes]|uniref:Receptor-like protein 12 n=1 Tax=Dichanthelium oligosanthes TaxID=888268 RepID=A0A1E5UK37_9POAL|nr:Receptor-like protein 12 [Dichanthelium oligosanthes]
MAKKSKAPAASAATEAVADETGVSSPQGSAHGSEGSGEKEGAFLLGQPTWEDAGDGRWRCAETGHELPEREKEAYARSRACRLALIEHAVARKKPPLNAFKLHPEHKCALPLRSFCCCSVLYCYLMPTRRDTINKSEEHIWKHINGKRFLNKLVEFGWNSDTNTTNCIKPLTRMFVCICIYRAHLCVTEKLEEQMASGEMTNGEAAKSNEVAKKSKSSKKDKKKTNVASPSLPREPKPEMDDSDDPDFWVPPVGSRWDDDDGKDRWESSPGKNDPAKNEGGSDSPVISGSNGSEGIPASIGDLASLSFLDLSSSGIQIGELPAAIGRLQSLSTLRLIGLVDLYLSGYGVASFNKIQGPIPIPVSPQFLDYSDNLFSSIPHYLMERLGSPFFLNLANNSLFGGIPNMLCNASSLQFFDLSYNYFSGHVPPCLVDGHLTILKMRQNQLEEVEGTLPDDIKGSCVSQTIDFNGNQIEGELPRSLSNCNNLEVFDAGNNNFSGSFPSWMMRLPKLRVLVLRSNSFSGAVGKIPVESDQNRTNFSSLQIIDLASNNFSGTLDSRWFEKLKAMMATSRNDEPLALENKPLRQVLPRHGGSHIQRNIHNGQQDLDRLHRDRLLQHAFTGAIPASIARLVSLRGLNLSDNAFTGTISPQFSGLKQLESLDLSSNQLEGQIPEALASLTSLAWLNVSYNQLEGSVPQGGQFLMFTNASFQGNTGLCGRPLSKQCKG